MPRVNEEYFENKRKEIVEAAYRVCTRKPITSVVMKDVIAETGFSHGVIYKYYNDLDEVLRDLVIKINSQHRFDERLDSILGQAEPDKWKSIIREVCAMLSKHMLEAGTDVLKISLYSDTLAMSEPERGKRIAKNLGKEAQSPLLYLVQALGEYLEKIIGEEKLEPVKPLEEILQFLILTYHGIQTGYVLSGCYDKGSLCGEYQPEKMFSCLAESIIFMMGG
jgi:AcrR family transcriptional regulator